MNFSTCRLLAVATSDREVLPHRGVSEGQFLPSLAKRGLNMKVIRERVNAHWHSALVQTSGSDAKAPAPPTLDCTRAPAAPETAL